MNLGKGFLIPQGNGVINNGDPWIPVTPEKPVMRMPNTVPAEMQGSLIKGTNWQEQLGMQNRYSPENTVTQTTYPVACDMQGDQAEGNSWLELLGIYSEVLQETPKNEAPQNFNGAGLLDRGEHNIQDGAAVRTNGCFNQNAGSYTQNIAKDIPARNNGSLMQLLGTKNAPAILPINGTPSRSIHGTDKFSTSSDPPNQNKWTNYPSVSSMLLQQESALPPNRRLMSSSVQQMPSDGFPVPYWPMYNLNSPPTEDTAASSCATSCFQFAPVTPDKGNLKNHQQNFSVDETLLQGKDKQEIKSTATEVGSYCDGVLHNVITSPSASNSKILTEKIISEDNVHGGIDLNKTPQQRPPRKKKHRPKVIVEGKPKRTPKPTASKANTSSENPSGKRRYVRRKGTDASNSGTENISNGIEASGVSSAVKSCRRVLNFDLEDKMRNQSENWIGDNQAEALLKSKPFDLNLTCQETACSAGCDRVSEMSSAKERQRIGCSPENQHGESISNLINSNNQKPAEKSLLLFPEASSPAAWDHTLNVIAGSLNLQNAAGQNSDESGHSQGHQHKLGDGTGQMILQENTASAKFDTAQQQMWQALATPLKDTSQIYETRGSKRDYCHISELTNPQSVDPMHSQCLSQDISKISKQKKDSGRNGIGTLEAHKRKKLENEYLGVASSISSSVKSVQDCSRQVESKGRNYIHASCSSSCRFGILPNPDLEMQKCFKKQNSVCNGIASDGCNTNTAAAKGSQEQESWSSVCLRLLNTRPRFEGKTASNTTDCLLHPTQGVSSTPGNETRTSLVDFSGKKETGEIPSSIQTFRKIEVHPEENTKEIGSQHSTRKAKGQKKEQNFAAAVEEIIHLMKRLEISNSGNDVVAKEQNAIVPYKGDNAIVTFEDPMKRRRPRPKVDLDPETNRVWNLLMGKAGSETTETVDMEKEKWWAKEREVVCGRVDSFIARMHLVQGDRRFSQWKGSVVDSVIGVFLTQNVSDHLSSSAFMSLAARFPRPLTTFDGNCCRNGAITWIEEPEVQIIDPDGTITYHGRMFSHPLYKRNSMTLSESSERRSDNLISETVSHLANDNTSGTEEEVVSSQNSCDSFLQATEDIRSSSESEVEDQRIRCNSNKNSCPGAASKTERASKFKQYQCHGITNSFLDRSSMPVYQQQENPPCITQYSSSNYGRKAHGNHVISDVLVQQGSISSYSGPWLSRTSIAGVHAPCSFGSLGQKSMSSLIHRSVEIANNAGVVHLPKKMGGMEGSTSSSAIQETGSVTKHAIAIDRTAYQNQQHKDDLQAGYHFLSSQQSISSNQVEASKNFELEGRSMIEPKGPDEADAQRQTGHLGSSSKLLSSMGTKSSNARKKKHELEKTKSFDWDSLRKKVLSKGGKKERNQDTMDSLDYEALRNADVETISETIRERGMNNMLAERIKDFLDRLVTEHGSIDLEWLRDVPADQAKDYLLSIRGLGLKSVECVRLLTLHQIAFPVDTNVGRIAVRLGWVPLQPLPESLQLHLLELYPVLESIQKYLWPRLCKLDQKTLYELHYQMITFGKVFCTKTKPNCNACPLRTECRHFASAYASARLALPAPEERSIVSPTTSVANGNASIIVKPMLLPPTETSEGLESQYIRANCEPIIEEPTTPEPSSEVSESDIEDMFYEDPDEIPTIKLSFEELKMNVESILQGQNMELQPGDLSRALVALDPSTASIPAPKLKSVSRLRTEHQVYELPDTHPLLEGMDRRERDDPSPYLLAIWNPGETANSTQPPASKCSLQGSGRLCNEKSCSMCHSIKEANSKKVKGTLLIPCRTAMRGSFPLNGTYFQVNEMFADHESSMNPIDVPRDWLWQLPRRTVYCGTSVTSIFRGLSTPVIRQCFWKGFVCVRGFDRKSRAPRPLQKILHEPASRATKNKNKDK